MMGYSCGRSSPLNDLRVIAAKKIVEQSKQSLAQWASINQQTMKLLILSLLLTLNIQSTGLLHLSVTDSCDKKPIVAATIIIYNGKDVFYATSDLEGNFQDSVPSGKYNIRVQAIGYEPSEVKKVIVPKNKKVSIAFSMKVKCQ